MSESLRGKPKLADIEFQFVFDKNSKTSRALIGLTPALCYTAWVVTIVPVKQRGCRRRRIRVRRRNGGAETVAPKRRRRNVTYRAIKGSRVMSVMSRHVNVQWRRCGKCHPQRQVSVTKETPYSLFGVTVAKAQIPPCRLPRNFPGA